MDGERSASADEPFDYHALKTATIYLIDGSKSMFTEKPVVDAVEEIAFTVALKCALKTLKSQIFGAPKDLFGVVLYGISPDTKPAMGKKSQYPGVHILIDLATPDADAILNIDQLLKDPEYKGLKPREDSNSDSPLQLAEGFWLCSKLFETAGKNISQTVLLFTAKSDPELQREQQKQAELRASDLMDAGARIEVVGLSQAFNFLPFYKDLVAAPGTEDSENLWKPPNSAQRLDGLLNQVVTLSRTRRPRTKIDFNIGENFKVSVGLYSLIREAGMPRKEKLDRKTNEALESITTKLSGAVDEEEMSADLLMRSDIVKYQVFGGEKIRLRTDEFRSLHRMGNPGLHLLGFKKKELIERDWFNRPCDFLYPEESVIKGSRSFIAALIQRCKAKDVVAIGRLIANTNSLPNLVALLPQEEVIDENGAQESPPGFHVFYLPYADDVRDIDLVWLSGEKGIQRADNEQIAVAKKIVGKLTQIGGYKPDLVQNPALRKLWSNIERMALEQNAEEFQDMTVVPDGILKKRIGELTAELSSLVPVDNVKPKKSYKKLPVFQIVDIGPAKKPKLEEDEDEKIKWRKDAENMLRNGNGLLLTIARLRDFLYSRGVRIPNNTKKPGLVALAEKEIEAEKKEDLP